MNTRDVWPKFHNLSKSNLQIYARKLIPSELKKDVENEVRAIDRLCKNSNPNIVQVLRHGLLKLTPSYYCIDMEFCDSSLRQYMDGETVQYLQDWAVIFRQGDERRHFILGFIRQVLNGLIFIHDQGLVHSDLSPDNGKLSHIHINNDLFSSFFFQGLCVENR